MNTGSQIWMPAGPLAGREFVEAVARLGGQIPWHDLKAVVRWAGMLTNGESHSDMEYAVARANAFEVLERYGTAEDGPVVRVAIEIGGVRVAMWGRGYSARGRGVPCASTCAT